MNFLCNDSDGGDLFIGLLVLAGFLVLLYLAIVLAGVVMSLAAAAGSVWGGGSAVWNYGKAFKEHFWDSNRTAMAG